MDDLKRSKQAVGAATLVAVNDIAPPAVLAQASRLQFSTRLFNLLVTNIPGPQVPLYILGHQLQDLFPLAFLPQGHALAVAIMSYNGRDRVRAARGLRRAARHRRDRRRHRRVAGRSCWPRQVQPRGAARRTNGRPEREVVSAASAPLLPTPHRRPVSGPAADMRAKRLQRARHNGKQSE